MHGSESEKKNNENFPLYPKSEVTKIKKIGKTYEKCCTTFSQQILEGKLLLTLIWIIYIERVYRPKKKKKNWQLFTLVDVADWYW